MRRMARNGYFFTLDAFIAAGIVLLGLFFIASSNIAVTVPYASFISSDTLLYLSNTKLVEIDNPFVNDLLITSLYADSPALRIDSAMQSTILQALGIFMMMDGEAGGVGNGGPSDYIQRGREFLNLSFSTAQSKDIIPLQNGLEVRVNDTVFFSRNASSNSRRIVVASRSMVFGTYNGTMWGPFPVEVIAWE